MPINYGSFKARHGVFLGWVLLFPEANVHKSHFIITSQTGLSGSLISKSVAVEKMIGVVTCNYKDSRKVLIKSRVIKI